MMCNPLLLDMVIPGGTSTSQTLWFPGCELRAFVGSSGPKDYSLVLPLNSEIKCLKKNTQGFCNDAPPFCLPFCCKYITF